MQKKSKLITLINFILSFILWLLGIFTLVFNILGLWIPWHLAGFAFIFYAPIPLVTAIISLILCYKSFNNKLFLKNLTSLLITIIFILFTMFVSAEWFW